MNLLKDLTVDALVSRLVAILFFSAVLGFATALLARLLDDRRPQFAERLTINPFSHVSVSGTLVAAVFCVGWIRTMPFDVKQNRWGAAGVLFAALAGLFLTALTIPLVDPLRSLAVNVLPQTGGAGSDPQQQRLCALPLRPYSGGRECGVRVLEFSLTM